MLIATQLFSHRVLSGSKVSDAVLFSFVALTTSGRRSPIGGASSLTADEASLERNLDLAGRVRELQQKNTQLNRRMQIQVRERNSCQTFIGILLQPNITST